MILRQVKTKSLLIFLFLIYFNSYSQCLKSGQLMTVGLVTHSTQNKYLDSVIYSEIDKLQNFFDVKIDFFFLVESNGKNAYFTPQCSENCVGSIVLGYNMLSEQLLKTDGIQVTKAILAHEFAHAVQHLYGWKEPGKQPELHADFIAGYYIGKTYNLSQEEMSSFYKTFAELGDNEFFSPNHHGTSAERLCAFYEGNYVSKITRITMQEALAFAYNYVEENSPCSIQASIQKKIIYDKDVASGNLGSVTIKSSTPVSVIISNYDGTEIRYRGVKNVTIEGLAVNLDYPIRIFETRTGTVRYKDKIAVSKYGPLRIKIKGGFGFSIKFPPPSR